MNKNNVLYEHQYGFREKYSTKLSLINLLNQLTTKTDSGEITVGIFLDFAKAFDTINHNILKQKLEHYGIRGLPLDWMCSYLSNRFQFVSNGNNASTLLPITCGVPQGSVLGPTLFLLYINDLPNSTDFFNFRLFADDSSLFHTFQRNVRDIDLNEVQQKVDAVIKWCTGNKLTINCTKTNYVLFRSRRQHVHKEGGIVINGISIKEVESVKFIGVQIDRHLTWKQHIDSVYNSLKMKIGVLFRLRPFVPRKTLQMIYHALIQPHITYGLEVWGGTYESYLKRIYLLQKRAVRIMSFKGPREHSNALFIDLLILDVFKLYKYVICTVMFDLINQQLPHNLSLYCQVIDHSYATRKRENHDFKIIDVKTNVGKQAIAFIGPKLWNIVPMNLRIKMPRYKFRKLLKRYLIENQI